MNRSARVVYPILIVLFGILLFCAGLGKTSLWANDEPIYGEIAKEMAQSGNWLTPMFKHQPWFCHPPLYMWLTGLTFKFFGWNEITARIFPSVFAILGLLLTYQFASDFWNRRVGFFSSLILATTLQYLAQGRMATMDTMLNSSLLAAFYAGWKAFETDSRQRQKWWDRFFLACAVATLAKGVFGLAYPLLVFGIFLLAQKEIFRWKEVPWKRGLLLYFLVASPWFILETFLYGKAFLVPVFYFYTFQRVVTPILRQSGPIYYYLPVLVFGFFPWSGFLVSMGAKAWQFRTDRKIVFLSLWVLTTFVFFSLVSTKLPNYIFFLYPPLAMLLACFWQGFRRREFLAAAGFTVLILVLLAYGLRIVILQKVVLEAVKAHLVTMNLILAVPAAGMILAFLLELIGKRKPAFFVIALSACLFWLIAVLRFAPVIEQYKPLKPMAGALQSYLSIAPGAVIVYHVPGADSLLFYDSLPYDSPGSPVDLLRRWRKGRVYCLLPAKELKQIGSAMKPYWALQHLQTLWLVSNFNLRESNPRPPAR